MSVMIVLACAALGPAGCGGGAGTGGRATEATRADVTLHVEGMTERLGLT